MNLLVEDTILERPSLTGDDGVLKARFVFLKADETTKGGGRVYPRAVLAKAVKDAQSKISQGGDLFGSTSRPPGRGLEVDDVSHRLMKLEMSGPDAFCEACILPTAKGKNLGAILRAGGCLAVSPRGYGECSMVEGREVVNRYELVGVDMVLNTEANRSVSGANLFESEAFEGIDEERLTALYEGAIRAGWKGNLTTFRQYYLRRGR